MFEIFFPGGNRMAEPLILASSSPRRAELLERAGIPFETDAPLVDESCSLPAEEAVAELSRRKALAAAAAHPGRFILASDTLVAQDGVSLGKPLDEADAARMLRALSGRTHHVCTGVTVISPDGAVHTGTDVSAVTFDELSEREIADYISSGEPMDKAGAYAIQGRAAMYVCHLDGCYSGVMGLPLYLVRRLLRSAGYPMFQ